LHQVEFSDFLEKIEMRKQKNCLNVKFFTITLILLLFASVLVMTTNFAGADITTNIDTFSFIYPAPSPVGVNQQVVVTYLVDKVNPIALIRSDFFTGFMVTISKPDGTTETMGPLSADSTSSGWFTYTPTQVGTYHFKVSFPGQWANSTAGTMTMFGPVLQNTNRWYKPSESGNVALVVSQNPVEKIQSMPFPTDYWTTPVSAENKGWSQFMDNWLMVGYDTPTRAFNGQIAFSPFSKASNTGHVMWAEPITYGGMVSKQFSDKNYYTGLVYEQFYMPIILSGRIIYVDHGPTAGSSMSTPVNNFGTRCLDLYTGEEIYYLTNVTIDFAQTLSIDTPNEHGVLSYLWTAPVAGIVGPLSGPVTWVMYDAWTGRQILTVANATPGTIVFGPKGEILSYTYDSVAGTLKMWNSTKCIFRSTPASIFSGGGEDAWSPPMGLLADWNLGIEWTVTVPNLNAVGMPSIQTVSIADNAILLSSGSLLFPNDQATYPPSYTDAALPALINRQSNGNYPTSVSPLWVKNRADMNGWVELHFNINDGMYSRYDDAKQVIHTYSIQTGEELSVTESVSNPPSLWAVFSHGGMAYGKNYICGYDGVVRCFDGKTGARLWEFALPSAGLETVYGTYPMYAGVTIADHKVYVSPDEHSPDADMWRGAKLYCIDADTGKELWAVSGYYHYQTISNGYVTAVNSYLQTIFTFGKGPSSTTVVAPQVGVVKGTAVMITGAVTDQSAGAKELVDDGKFSAVAAVSDESQDGWMDYLYMQHAKPTDVKGVQVKLTATDSNGQSTEIGSVTSDSNGNFGYTWTPNNEGTYKIVASFAGTNAYGSSDASTYLTVSPSTSAGAASSGTDFTVLIAVAIITLIVAIIAVLLLLRKR
jgi:hypothetical protein